jgi:hypothetical protein
VAGIVHHHLCSEESRPVTLMAVACLKLGTSDWEIPRQPEQCSSLSQEESDTIDSLVARIRAAPFNPNHSLVSILDAFTEKSDLTELIFPFAARKFIVLYVQHSPWAVSSLDTRSTAINP